METTNFIHMISTQSEDMCRRLLMKNLFGNEITRLEKFRMLVNLHRFNTMYHKRSVFETRNKLVYEGYKAMLDFNLPLEDNMPGLARWNTNISFENIGSTSTRTITY